MSSRRSGRSLGGYRTKEFTSLLDAVSGDALADAEDEEEEEGAEEEVEVEGRRKVGCRWHEKEVCATPILEIK